MQNTESTKQTAEGRGQRGSSRAGDVGSVIRARILNYGWLDCLRSPAFRLLSAFCLLLFVFCLLPVSVVAQQVVDKMVATVNAGARTDLITYSDLMWQLALQPNTPLDNPSSEDLNHALRLVIDQRLILQEAEKLPTIAPTAKEISDELAEFVKEFPSQAEFQQRLLKVGLTSEKLAEILDQRERIEKYLDFRFRNFVVVSQTEIADYYRDVYVPRTRARYPGRIMRTLEEARAEIETTLREGKVESDTDAFLDTVRERAEIVMLNPV